MISGNNQSFVQKGLYDYYKRNVNRYHDNRTNFSKDIYLRVEIKANISNDILFRVSIISIYSWLPMISGTSEEPKKMIPLLTNAPSYIKTRLWIGIKDNNHITAVVLTK